ncbi:VacJ family lipoprotein [Candidatus Binatus sp.]|uniref:MlaA family lipoprotein n=1 Tax=Candidatus Binatus sp. TaxID=2811406 RepID=UPI002F936C75
MTSGPKQIERTGARWMMLASFLLAVVSFATPALSQGAAPMSQSPAAQSAANPSTQPPGENNQGGYADPMSGFNEPMFTFNLKLDDWVLRPVASGYATITPQPVRESVDRFFDNVRVIPRFANNLLQLKLAEAGGEVARFGINTTIGLVGFFDPADELFGLKKHPNDFGLTIRYYDIPTGPYLMLPFFGPSTIGDTVGLAADGAMDPISYFVPLWVAFTVATGEGAVEAVNYRSLHLNQFEEADRYAIDLYGAVQDAYLQTRDHDVKKLHEERW